MYQSKSTNLITETVDPLEFPRQSYPFKNYLPTERMIIQTNKIKFISSQEPHLVCLDVTVTK